MLCINFGDEAKEISHAFDKTDAGFSFLWADGNISDGLFYVGF